MCEARKIPATDPLDFNNFVLNGPLAFHMAMQVNWVKTILI